MKIKIKHHRLFVYGIFLSDVLRKEYGMYNPEYTTVLDHTTYGHHIVEAKYRPGEDLALTGLVVDMFGDWDELDRLEGAYDRKIVRTTDNEEVYIYIGKDRGSRW